MSIYDDTRCSDCNVETNHLRRDDLQAEWYMVAHDVWEAATKDKPANFLCIGCLEERIARKLTPADFPTDIPLNAAGASCDVGWGRSFRLRNRMFGIKLK